LTFDLADEGLFNPEDTLLLHQRDFASEPMVLGRVRSSEGASLVVSVDSVRPFLQSGHKAWSISRDERPPSDKITHGSLFAFVAANDPARRDAILSPGKPKPLIGADALSAELQSLLNKEQAIAVANAIADQTAVATVPFTLTFPTNTFVDPEGQTLTYTATMSDDTALPSWLTFNAGTRTFSGTPASGDAGTLTVKVTATDNGSPNLFGSLTFNITTSVDSTPPTISIGSPSVSLTNTGAVTYTVTYADANFSSSTLANGNITLNKTGTANGSVAVTGSGTTRTVTISSITGDGTLGISIAAGTASDTTGNLAPAAGPSTTFTVDNTAPTISIGSPSVSSTTSGPVTYTVTYADANFSSSTLANGNITLNKTGTANG
ncbi:MAG: hypothetical protein EBU23_17960, partial [Mycobacteriaceae bacterium]|nr:hypothetical protein [Mycobacteriaceae bacterium]